MSDKQSYLYENKDYVANLNEARLSGKLCDVTIVVNGKKFRAHKIILAAHLKYFASMFFNTFQESEQDVVTMQGLQDLESQVEAFISFAYTGQMLMTVSNALGLLEVANYLSEDNIKESCIKFLEEHLRKEDACQAYVLANSIELLKLKSVAIQKILSNFGECSQTEEFLDLDFASLKEILSSAKLKFAGPQKILFEGIVSWICHKADYRRTYINDLLHSIELTQLNGHYLLKFLCEKMNDQCDIVKDIMTFYGEKTQKASQVENVQHKIMAIGMVDLAPHVQYYDFTKRKWSEHRKIKDYGKNHFLPGIILNAAYYYTTRRNVNESSLHVFHLPIEKSIMLIPDYKLPSSIDTRIMCTCGKFVYFCGGYADKSHTGQLSMYDPCNKTLDILPPMKYERAGTAAIFYQGCLHVLGGYNGSNYLQWVEKYEPDTKRWVTLPSMCETRNLHAVAVLNDKLYACGGWTKKSVEVYDPSKKRWQLVASMNNVRFNFIVVVYQGKLFAIGGDEAVTVEVYDPHEDQWQIDNEMSSGLQINIRISGGLIPSSYATEYFE